MIRALQKRLALLARDTESGAAMVEFVVVFPFQLTLTLMLLQFAFLAHAHLVVQQAAFAGARAAAVADGMTDSAQLAADADPGIASKDAALRSAARTLSVLAAGVAPTGASLGTAPAIELRTDFRWANSQGGRMVPEIRQDEAYSLISIELSETDNAVGVTVQYDYVMTIPVAAKILADMQGLADRVLLPQGLHPFRIRRKAYIPTPWRAHPSVTSSASVGAASDAEALLPENQ